MVLRFVAARFLALAFSRSAARTRLQNAVESTRCNKFVARRVNVLDSRSNSPVSQSHGQGPSVHCIGGRDPGANAGGGGAAAVLILLLLQDQGALLADSPQCSFIHHHVRRSLEVACRPGLVWIRKIPKRLQKKGGAVI